MRYTHFLPITLLLATSCSPSPITHDNTDETEATADQADALVGGTSYDFWPSVVRINYGGSGCSGTVVGIRHVLTASHCFPRDVINFAAPATGTVTLSSNGLNQTAGIIGIISALAEDAAIVVTDQDLKAEPVAINFEPMDSWTNRRVLSIGVGTPSNTKQGGWVTITDIDDVYYQTGISNEPATCPGDSGGPNLAWLNDRWYVVGVHKAGSCTSGATSYSTRSDKIAKWLLTVVPQHGRHISAKYSRNVPSSLFNNAGSSSPASQDYLVSTDSSLMAIRSGITAWMANQLPLGPNQLRLGRAEPIQGAFNGDSRADLGILTPTGFGLYPATAANQFDLTTPWLTTDSQGTLPTVDGNGRPLGWAAGGAPFGTQIGVGKLMIADFNGDGRADVLLSDTNQTTLFINTGSSLTQKTVIAVPQHDATFTVEDFTGDGRADVIIQTNDYAHLYRGTSSGQLQFTTEYYGFERGKYHFTPGRFIPGTPGADLIATSTSGTFLLAVLSTGELAATGFQRPDLKANENAYTAGDFNGDGVDDLLIANTSGSYMYLGTGTPVNPFVGTAWVRNDLPIDSTTYDSRDQNGDGRDDLWIARPEAAYGYSGRASSPYLAQFWKRTDLRLGRYRIR